MMRKKIAPAAATIACAAALCSSAIAQQGGPPSFRYKATQSAHDAASTTYIPPGSGALPSTASREFDRTIWVNDRGAACNGVADDSAAFQSAIDEAIATGASVRFLGPCAIASTIQITASVDLAGGGPTQDPSNGGGTTIPSWIIATNPSVDGIFVSTAGAVNLHDFALSYSTPPTGDQELIRVSPTSGVNSVSNLERVKLFGGRNCILMMNTQMFVISKSYVQCSNKAIEVGGTVNPDAGDSTVYGSVIQSGEQGTALLWTGSGGLRFENNKINGPGPLQGMAFGIRISPAPGVRTSDIFIVGNSIEGLSTVSNGYGVFAQRSDTTTSVGNIIITSNEIAGHGCVYIPTDATAAWMGNVVINNNACGVQVGGSASFGFSVDGVIGLSIVGNTITGPPPSAGVSTAIGSGSQGETAATCAIAFNPHYGSFGPSAPGSCTVAAPF